MKKRFYYSKSIIYGWCVYDRNTNEPAYNACAELLPPVKQDESGTVTVSPTMLESEYKAMSLCTKLNISYKKSMKEV